MGKQPLTESHLLDELGRPAGGMTSSTGLVIQWQNGPLGRGEEREEPNGAFVETVIRAAIGRLQFYNEGQFRCRENSLAITHLEEALHWCNARTARREDEQVEGTHDGS